MKYPVKITKKEQQFEGEIPDLPGCNSVGNSVEEVMFKLEGAVANHLQILAEYGESIPHAQTVDFHLNQLMMAGNNHAIIWAIVDIDIVPYLGKSHKINVTLPELLIKQIDDRVSKSEHHKTRSGFIAHACIRELRN